MMGCSDTPQEMLTPRRVALAAEVAFADGLPPFFAPVFQYQSRCLVCG